MAPRDVKLRVISAAGSHDRVRYIQIGDRVIDLEVGHVHHHSETTQLPPRLLSLLRFFAEHGDRVLSRDDIIEGVWGHLEAA